MRDADRRLEARGGKVQREFLVLGAVDRENGQRTLRVVEDRDGLQIRGLAVLSGVIGRAVDLRPPRGAGSRIRKRAQRAARPP